MKTKTIQHSLKHLGEFASVAASAQIAYPRNVEIGSGSYIGERVWIDGNGGVSIAAYSIIAPEVLVVSANHNYRETKFLPYDNTDILDPVTIGRGVWIRQRATLLPGVSIGDGAVVGACSVVTKNVPEGAIVAGNPAKIVATRDQNQLNQMLENNWFYMMQKINGAFKEKMRIQVTNSKQTME